MTLRRKTLIIIFMTVLSGVALTYAAGRLILLERFGRLERAEAIQNVERAVGALNREIEQLTLLASDYAAWTDTYDFIETGSQAYADSNLTHTTFVDNRVNSILFYNRFGEPVRQYTRDLETAESIETPEELTGLLEASPTLGSFATTMSHHSGLLWVEAKLYLISSQPIVTSDREGPIRGTLIMARLLDEDEKARLAETTLLDLTLTPIVGSFQGDTWRAIRLQPISDNRIDGSVIVPDALDQPVAEMVARLPRPVMQEGRQALLYLLVAVLAIGIAVGAVTVGLLESLVIRRMSELSEKVQSIGSSREGRGRVGVSGRDELSQLAATINGTLEALELSQDALRYVGKNARCLLWTAEAREREGDCIDLQIKVQDEDAAQRVFPLEVDDKGTYADTWRQSIVEEDASRASERMREALLGGERAYSLEYRVRLADGSTRWIADEVDVQARGPGRWRLAGVGTDVTTKREAAEEVQRARDAALDVARLKSDFLANMSHEIRTPMNGILGMTDLLLDSEMSEEQREQLGMVRSSAETLLRVINDILDFSKIEAGRLEVVQSEFCLRQTLDNALALLSLQAQLKGLALAVDVAPDVPECVLGDPVRLTQVISNLTSNGIKFTDDGDVHISVSRAPTEGEDVLQVCVVDTGMGIEPDKQEVIFESFRQADSSTTRRFGGTGLGLAICQRLVELMGGRMWLESTPGAGSRFYFTVVLRSTSGSDPVPEEGSSGWALLDESCSLTTDALSNRLARYGVGTASGAVASSEIRSAIVCLRPVANETRAAINEARAQIAPGAEVRLLTEEAHRAEADLVSKEYGLGRPLRKPVREGEIGRFVEQVYGASLAHERLIGADDTIDMEAMAAPARVLVAEDNVVNQRVARRLLEKAGHTVEIVDDGAVAVERALSGAFDVALLDIQMPTMGGEDAARMIRSKEHPERRLPLIALTAHAMRGDRERFLAAGMDGYVAKPVHASELHAEMARVLGAGEGRAQPPTRVEGETTLDLDEVAARLGGDRELALEALLLFRDDCESRLGQIESALEGGAIEEVARAAHGLRGALSQIAATRGAAVAEKLERTCEQADMATTRSTLEALRAELRTVLAQIERIAENGQS